MRSQTSRDGRAEKRQADLESDPLPIRTSPTAKRRRQVGNLNAGGGGKADVALVEPYTILDYLSYPYQSLQTLPEPQEQREFAISGTTQSASDSWGWRDIKKVDTFEPNEVSPEVYLQKFDRIFSLDMRNHELATPGPDLPDIDLFIVSEKQLEILLHKTVIERVNRVLQIVHGIAQDLEDGLGLFEELPGLVHRPAYTAGLRSGSPRKTMIPDLWCGSFFDPKQKQPPFLVGDIKLYRKWAFFLGQSTENDSLVCFRTVLAQINFYMIVRKCAWAVILIEAEAVVVERVAGWKGWLRVSRPFIGQRNMSIALLGVCLHACATDLVPEPERLMEASPDVYFPREVIEPPSSSSKAMPSTASYSPSIADPSSPLPPRSNLERKAKHPIDDIDTEAEYASIGSQVSGSDSVGDSAI